ncbi:MAG: hypothetical protein EPO40_08315 [Myxococcaceae bacterium]|nr:MAG: hypothetical protein EPO40_08315 [Myxococcaceae bacterium]
MNTSKRRLAPSLLLALAPLAGCATVSPPPSAMALEGASQGPVGGTSVTAFGAAAGGVFVSGSLGGGARIAHRLSNTTAIGVEGIAGSVVDPGDTPVAPRQLYAGRLHVQVNPGASEHVAMTLGVGLGATNNSLSYSTLDAGVRFSHRWFDGFFEPYVGGVVALSVPGATPDGATRSADGDRRFMATGYLGLDGGFVLHATERLDVALDVLILGGYSASADSLLIAPSAGVRYAFGGETARR